MARRSRTVRTIAAQASAACVVVGVAIAVLGSVRVVALAILVPLVVALTRRPQRGLLLLAALVPFDGLLLLVHVPPLLSGWKEALVLIRLGASFFAPAEPR